MFVFLLSSYLVFVASCCRELFFYAAPIMFIFGITNTTGEFHISIFTAGRQQLNNSQLKRRKTKTAGRTCDPPPLDGGNAPAQTAGGQAGKSKKTSTFCGVCAHKMSAYLTQYIRQTTR